LVEIQNIGEEEHTSQGALMGDHLLFCLNVYTVNVPLTKRTDTAWTV